MANLEQVLADVARTFNSAGVPYMVIGGMANAVWGAPRSTVDVDLTVGLSFDSAPRLLEVLGDQVAAAPPNAANFARDTGVLPFTHRRGPRVELMASVPYAHEALARAVVIDVASVPVNFCTPEDLILHKLVSSRERDRNDVAALLKLRGATLDRAYLDPRVHELACLLDDSSIEQRYAAFFAG